MNAAREVFVAGAGAFGTALAVALARDGVRVTLWARDKAQLAEMTRSRCNTRYLPGIELPPAVVLTGRIAPQAATVLLAVPMQSLNGFLQAHGPHFTQSTLVACCKGIDLATLRGPGALIAEHCPRATPAVLTGPSFAADIARGLPTALTVATPGGAEGLALQSLLSTPVLRIYHSADMVGAELGGALKNVMAIAAGIVIGAGLGDSARAAMMTRAFAEMSRLARALGAQRPSLDGLAGLGDMILTCTSEQSRNFRFGLALGRGEAFPAGITVEGAATARAAARLAAERRIEMPITAMVAAVLDGSHTIPEAVQALLSRPLRQE